MLHAYVIGTPIGHSISPAIHNAAFAACGVDARYEAVDVRPEALAAWVAATRASDVLGFNVTVPHKEAIVPLLDRLDGDAPLAGAVNTVLVDRLLAGMPGEKMAALVGQNTDTVGFRRSLEAEAGVSMWDQRVVLLGAGGAARAVAMVALQDGAAELIVANRNGARAQRLLAELEPLRSATATGWLTLTETGGEARAAIAAADIVVNATSVGMGSTGAPPGADAIAADSLVVDLVYRPAITGLMKIARDHGADVLGGLGMLVYQAAAAFELWTGVPAPVVVMRRAAEAALHAR